MLIFVIQQAVRDGVRLAAALVFAVCGVAQAEELPSSWTALPPRSAGIVLLIDADVASVSIISDEKKEIDRGRWLSGIPFARQYRLPSGWYSLVPPTVQPI